MRTQNGDLALDGAKYGIVNGNAKLVQDLRAQLLERMGTDSAHPGFGSLIDGGRQADGTEIPSPLGGIDWNRIVLDIETELRRIEKDYQSRQAARINSDRYIYSNSTLTPDEVLVGINGIQFQRVQDTLFVKVTITTASGNENTLNIPVGTAPIV